MIFGSLISTAPAARPSIGHEYQKVRPALIVEGDSYLSLGNLITVIPISSQLHKSTLLDVLIAKTLANRLVSDSLIKTRQVSTFVKRRFIKYIGPCEVSVLWAVLNNLSLYLSLPV
ncbi:type II toxin-antitoxin system PemK/MazF family toxin [Spirosoma areae]